MSKEKPDNVTLMVFKDNFAARTFQIPVSWFSRFGIFLGLLIGVAITSVFVAVKYYRIAQHSDLAHLQDLEQELAEAKANASSAASSQASPQQTAAAAPTNPSTPSAALPVQPDTNAVPPATGVPISFNELPSSFQLQVPDRSTLNFTLQPPTATWRGKSLRVKFAFQYTKTDQGTQQGRIFILARGPDTLLGYPTGIFRPQGDPVLIDLEKGESFSVSRFREVKADFPAVKSKESIQSVEIFILDSQSHLLAYEKISPKQSSTREGEQKRSDHSPTETAAQAAPVTEPPRTEAPAPNAPIQEETKTP